MVSTPRVPQIGFTRRSGRCGEVLRLFRNISITVMAIAGNRPPRPTIVQHFDLRGSLLFDLPQRSLSSRWPPAPAPSPQGWSWPRRELHLCVRSADRAKRCRVAFIGERALPGSALREQAVAAAHWARSAPARRSRARGGRVDHRTRSRSSPGTRFFPMRVVRRWFSPWAWAPTSAAPSSVRATES